MMQDAPPLRHLHHITAVAGSAARTVRFYRDLLGLCLVKRTVNFDDPRSHHLYFACSPAGEPGGLLTFFVWPDASKGRWGIGTTHHVALMTENEDAQDRWKRLLTDRGVRVTGPYDRRYFRSIYFTDPDGLILEIATRGPGFDAFGDPVGSPEDPFVPPSDLTLGGRDEESIAAHTWPHPVTEIDDEMRLKTLHHVTCVSGDDHETDLFYTEVLAMRRVRWTLNFDDPRVSHTYYANDTTQPGSAITFFGFDPANMHQGRIGIGLVHHIAYACADDDEQALWRRRLREAGLNVTPQIDRTYFRSIYFSDPSGLLLEIATLPPGFAVDEPASALGSSLMLPPQLEPRRAEIEAALEPLS